jgi:peptidoglycan DL-endopeptidase CwlO
VTLVTEGTFEQLRRGYQVGSGRRAWALAWHAIALGRRTGLALGAVVLSATLVLSTPAEAAPATPTEEEVEQARRTAQQRDGEAAMLQQRLDELTAQLRELEIAAGEATEAFNAAREALAKAEADEAAAQAARVAAEQRAEASRRHLGQLAAATYRTGGELATVNLILDAGTERALFDGAAVMRQITASYDIVYTTFRAARHQAAAAAVRAHEATLVKREAAEDTERRRAAAAHTASTGQQRMAAVLAERDVVLAQLAAARATTVELERARQEGLQREAEARARKQAEERARQEAEERARKEAAERERKETEERARKEAEQRSRREVNEQARSAERNAASLQDAAARVGGRSPLATAASLASTAAPKASARAPNIMAPAALKTVSPKPASTPVLTQTGGGKYTSSGADRAVAFVRAQLGKPYVYGGAGPDSFDCSGLTMRAWQAGGVRTLTHSARAQYRATSRVAYGDLRRGDLIFWSRAEGDPATIYHVGMYIGAGRMIHAPNPSRPVEEKSVFYMGSPIGYGRV